MTRQKDPGRVAAAGDGQPAALAMAPGRRPIRHTAGLVLALSLAAAPMLAACGSATAHASGSPAHLSATCAQVSAALSDGPDPGADPVGYAEAQIKPLRAITTSDSSLRRAIGALATAYADVFDSNGKNASATKAVASASKKLDAICPGAAS